jgi:hypothetical protein
VVAFMTDNKIFIHVGLHKTGTTFLQREIFSKLKNVNYIHPPRTFLQKDIYTKIPKVRVSFFTPEKTLGDRPEFKPIISSDKINIISRESLSGAPSVGYIDGDVRFTIADRIKKHYPNSKIIIGVREKKSWLFSSYGQYVRGGGTYSYDDWYNKIFDKKYLDFDTYLKYLKNLFNDVYVYKIEDLRSDPKEFVKNLCGFIGVDIPEYELKIHNKGFNEKQMKLARFINRFYRSQLNPRGIIFRHIISPKKIINLFG